MNDDEAKKAAARKKQADYMREVWYPKHKEEIKAYQIAYHRANPEKKNERERRRRAEQPEQIAKSFEKYKAKHADRLSARKARYYAANRESLRIKQEEYRKNNLEVWNDARRRRRARVVNAPEVERFKSSEIYERDGWMCQICDKPVDKKTASIDHVVPLAKEGAHTRANAQTAHRVCNSRKGTKLWTPLPERTPDGYARVWCLYTPEPYSPDSPNEREINLWVRRCSVFTSQQHAIEYLNGILSQEVAWRPYDPLFPELWIGFDSRGSRWLLEAAPVDPLRPQP